MGAGRGAALVVACAAGIYGAYLTQGYVQESMCAIERPPEPHPRRPLAPPPFLPPPPPSCAPPPSLPYTRACARPLVPPAGRAVSPNARVSGRVAYRDH